MEDLARGCMVAGCSSQGKAEWGDPPDRPSLIPPADPETGHCDSARLNVSISEGYRAEWPPGPFRKDFGMSDNIILG